MEVTKILPFTKEYWKFIHIATKSFPLHFPLIIWSSLRRVADVIICKLDDKIIGGFILTDLPLNTFIFRPKIFFNVQKTGVFKKLIEGGYRYLTYVVINEKYRSGGLGLEMLIKAKEKYDIKSYLTPFTAELQSFYEQCGAMIYKTKDGKTLEGLKCPVMVFDR